MGVVESLLDKVVAAGVNPQRVGKRVKKPATPACQPLKVRQCEPQQLPQVSQGTHYEPGDQSALGWLVDGAPTLDSLSVSSADDVRAESLSCSTEIASTSR